jgi:23S rRNA (uridine2552-2'-O)-methyltransferase
MSRGKKSSEWMRAHVRDPYVRRARGAGYRSRAAYKLVEITERDRLLRPGMTVVDLGAAPGSWSQVLAERVGRTGRIVAADVTAVVPIPGVSFIQGDFREPAVVAAIVAALGGAPCDLVISDMSPNLSGVSDADQARSLELCGLALEFALQYLKQQGSFLVKVFQGAGYPQFLSAMRAAFETVASRKPGASRERSSEMYLLGRRLRNTPPVRLDGMLP